MSFPRALRCALAGLADMLRTQGHARFHLVATFGVIVAGAVAHISLAEWALMALASGGVWTAEALNTAVELLADRVTREHDPLIGRAKDVAAGAVLLASTTAVVVGSIVFIPRLLAQF